jgi:hypothetical protein
MFGGKNWLSYEQVLWAIDENSVTQNKDIFENIPNIMVIIIGIQEMNQ